MKWSQGQFLFRTKDISLLNTSKTSYHQLVLDLQEFLKVVSFFVSLDFLSSPTLAQSKELNKVAR